jgi:hypothetical protein
VGRGLGSRGEPEVAREIVAARALAALATAAKDGCQPRSSVQETSDEVCSALGSVAAAGRIDLGESLGSVSGGRAVTVI